MRRGLLALVFGAVLGCNAPAPLTGTGGVDPPSGACGRGLVLVSTDYQSTNVSLLDTDGAILSASVISSASESSGLSAPLSGDVVAPTARVVGPSLVLIDRYPASVLTFVELATGEVSGQLDVSTGFASNPRDYLEVDERRAYVTRFESNREPGAEAFDGGGDILVVDPWEPAILARIDLSAAMSDAPGFLPRPSRMVRHGDDVFVLLLGYNHDFSAVAPARLARVDSRTDTLGDVVVLPDLSGCEGLALSPDATELAVACSGPLRNGATQETTGSGLAVLDRATLTVSRVTRAAELVGQPLGFSAAFTRRGDILVTALGAFGSGGDDVLDAVLRIQPDGTADTVLRSVSRPFELGEVRCTLPIDAADAAAACGQCFVADAERGVLQRLDPTTAESDGTIALEDGIGLPPRLLGRF